jgi:DNA-binding NarL/FixJ family response regulator
MRVLIADDSPLLVERVAAVVAEVGETEVVGHAGSVADAARAVRSLNPDVLILDLQMPGGSGIEVLEGISRDRLTPVVIVLTNHGGSQYRRKCLQAGAHFFFDKSAEFEKLAPVLRSLNRNESG